MSLRYRDKNGAERVISGLTPGGDIEYGAVATRSGTVGSPTITIPANNIYGAQVTFDTAMPDADYEVTLTAVTLPTNLGGKLNFEVYAKTANGFTIGMYNGNDVNCAGVSMKWKAFKLYTVADAEALYSKVLDIEAMIPSSASSTNKFATADDLRTETKTLDRRLDDVEDVIPSSASIINKLATAADVEEAMANAGLPVCSKVPSSPKDKDVMLYIGDETGFTKGGIYQYIADPGAWVLISTADVDLSKYETSWTGTKAEWDALSASEKKQYKIANITDDVIGGEVADEVTDGDMRPVTSNAVFDELATKVSKSDVVDNLTSTSTTAPLSAAQGKKLNEKFTYRQFSDTTEYTLTGSSSGRTPQLVWTISNLAVTKGIYLVDCYVQSLSGLGGPVNFYIGRLNPTVGTNNGNPSLYHTVYAGAAYSVMRDIKTIPIESDQTISIYVGIDIMANSSCKVTNKWLTFTKIADATS